MPRISHLSLMKGIHNSPRNPLLVGHGLKTHRLIQRTVLLSPSQGFPQRKMASRTHPSPDRVHSRHYDCQGRSLHPLIPTSVLYSEVPVPFLRYLRVIIWHPNILYITVQKFQVEIHDSSDKKGVPHDLLRIHQ